MEIVKTFSVISISCILLKRYMMEGSTSHNSFSKSHVPASLHHWTHMSWQSKDLSCKFLILPILMPLLQHIFHM